MKIVYVCNEYPLHAPSGGIGVFTQAVARALVTRGHKVTVVGYGKHDGEWNDQGVRLVILPELKVRGVAWLVNRRRLYGWLKNEARLRAVNFIELPESHGLCPFAFPWCPTAVRLHTSRCLNSAHARLRFLEKRTLSRHRNWIAVSHHVLQETLTEYHVRPNHSKVIYNPVVESSGKAALPLQVPEQFVLYVGTVSERKGAFVLAQAARSFLLKFPHLHLLYVGRLTTDKDRRADDTIRATVGRELAKRVHFVGPVEHNMVLAYMKKARVFAFPSKLEALGLVPIEAMSCGVPVIYSASHAGPEVIDDGVTGLLADPDSPEDVAEKVIRVIEDPILATRLAEKAKQVVKERFSLQRCIDETLAFYERIIREKG